MNIYIDGIIYSLQKGGGVTRYTDELINGFIKQGHNVTILEHSKTSNKSLRSKEAQIIDIKSPLKVNNRILKFITYPIHKWKTNRYLKKINIKDGVFHSSYFTNYKSLKIPQIITIHDLTREKFPQYFNIIFNKIILLITKNYAKKSDAIVCVSKETANELLKYYKIPPQKINVTHLGVNDNFKTKTTNEKSAFLNKNNIKKPYILFVGQRSGYKNFERFIDAFASWNKKNNFSIILVGGGKITEKETIFLNKLKIQDKVTPFGYATEDDLVMLYNNANSFIYPSLSEGFGLPILEAMACGTTVLASNIPVFYEIAGDIPYYFNPENKESIINAMNESLILNLEKINNGIEHAKNFTWDNTIKKTLDVYSNISNNFK